MSKTNEVLKAVAHTPSSTSSTTLTPYATGTTGGCASSTTNTLGQDYGHLLNQYQQLQQAASSILVPKTPPTPAKLPSKEHIKQRLAETQALLDLLKEVDRILNLHPDLERLIGTLARFGQL